MKLKQTINGNGNVTKPVRGFSDFYLELNAVVPYFA